ncbi:MAG: hypothetical protein JO148_04350 [Acidimicrobiia bacterium]|nr:hypothetical protein [Acidimicrobiia bacterium]
MRVALVTNKTSTDLITDGPPLLAAFGELGVDVDVVQWGSGPRWAAFDAVVIRNTWDYIFDRDGFLAWAEAVAAETALANAADVLRWNTDKRYLRELEAAGIRTVPTAWVEAGDAVPTVEWDDFVVKPSVSCGARLSARYRLGDDIAGHIERIHGIGAAAMIQPYVGPMDGRHETGVYVFGGEVSHAIRKEPVLDDVRVPQDDLSGGANQVVGPSEVATDLAAHALGVLQCAPSVLYARVDTVLDPDGEPMLMELEVTEPFLFLEHAPDGAPRFARAVADWVSRSR